MKYSFYLLIILGLGLSSCVSLKKYKEVGANYEACKDEKKSLEKQYKELKDKYSDIESISKKMVLELKQLKSDTGRLKNDLIYAQAALADMTAQFDALQVASGNSAKGKEKEMRQLLTDYQKSKDDLLQKEDELKNMEKALNEREDKLNKLNTALKDKEIHIAELEKVLQAKDSAVVALKKKVNDALLGYVNKGLSISQKNGKVYVSMDESLLFATASWQVGPEGTEALKKLVKVLKDNPDISIMVEGHTDNVPYKGSGQIKDNWDLSVLRATSVVKIILESGDIQPSRVTATGRGEFTPLDPSNTKEARSKNRRTEIILTPKLDQLFKILDNN